MSTTQLNPAELRKAFSYDPETGALLRTATGRSAVVYAATGKNAKPAARVNLPGYQRVAASHVIYALVHDLAPDRVRVRHLDRNATNLRLANLQFNVTDATAPGARRTIPAILDTLAAMGGRGTSLNIRQRGQVTRGIGSYLYVLERQGRVHIAGLDHTGRVPAYVWALGPGEPPAEVTAIRTARSLGRGSVVPSERKSMAAGGVLALARNGRVPSSVFNLAQGAAC